MWCFKCDLAKHFSKNCYDSNPRNNVNAVVESDQVHMTLYKVDTPYWTLTNNATISDSNEKISNLEKETFDMAVSTCSWTVAREVWFNIFSDTLNDQDKNFEKISKSNRTIFGDRAEVKSSMGA